VLSEQEPNRGAAEDASGAPLTDTEIAAGQRPPGEPRDGTSTADDDTAYGRDQDREATSTAPGDEWQDAADRNPDDFGPDSVGGTDVNPDTGREFGSID
jgi:hypothetical protein